MSLPLDFHSAVRDEIDTDFLNEVERVVAAIIANPARYGVADGDIREGLLTRFPYVVYYRVLRDRIRVLAVYHTSRSPSGWQLRT